jgi:RNA polymerase sigma factor (sigma-70 family)
VPSAQDWSSARTSDFGRADLDALIAREYMGLRLLLSRQTRDPELAADLLNDAVCTAWEKWRAGQIERPELIAGYVFRVAMNLLRNQRRSVGDRADKRADPGILDAVCAEQSPDPVEQAIAKQVQRILRGMTPHRDRIVLVRFYLEEEGRETICRDLGLTADQFARILHRARRRLRELVEAQGIRSKDLFLLLLTFGGV